MKSLLVLDVLLKRNYYINFNIRLSGYTYVITILQSEGSNGEDIFGKSSARIRETIERSNDMFSNDIFGEKKQEYEYLSGLQQNWDEAEDYYRIKEFVTFVVSLMLNLNSVVSGWKKLTRVSKLLKLWIGGCLDINELEWQIEMDLNAFIRTADPRKVRIVERARTENERPIVTVAKHRTVTLLPTSVVRSSGELSASVEREFAGDASVGDGGDQGFDSVGGQDDVEPTVPVTEPVGTEIPRPKRSKKKRVTRESERMPAASHPPIDLRLIMGLGWGSATGALPTLPFITSSVTASPLEEGGDRTDSATGPSLRTIGPSARFVVLSDSSHHSGAKSADPEVDSLVRSAAPIMTEATTVATVATTVAIPANVSKDKSAPHPSIFGSSSSSEKTDRTLSLFTGRSGSGFDAGSIRAEEAMGAGLEETYVPEWTVTRGFELNDGRLCANMIDHFTPPAFFKTVRGMEHEQLFMKRKWRSLAEEKDILLAAKDKEIEDLKSQLLIGKEDSIVVGVAESQLRAQVSVLRPTENSTSRRSCFPLRPKRPFEHNVHELEISSMDLREKLEMYEGSLKYVFREFPSAPPQVVAGRRWLLTHGMKLLVGCGSVKNATLLEGGEKIDASARGDLTFSQLDDEARDAVL
ncbi:hypothetical protein Tco_1327461 [Tanacetum coccineum]